MAEAGGRDWLALTSEPTLEPDLPICDAHHHLWEFRPEPVHYQRYLLSDLAEDLNSGHKVRSTVFIEVKARYRTDGLEEMRPVGEVEFVEGLATEGARGQYGQARMAAAIIGYADLKLGARVAPVLDAMQAASPARFRGVRHSVGWDPSPELANRDIQGLLASDNYRAGARELARRGLCLENSLYHPQLTELALFARAVPDLTIILNHIGGLVRVGPYANRDDAVLPRMAARHCRRGGLSQRDHQARRCRAAPLRLRLGATREAHRLGRAGRDLVSLDAVLH